MRLLASLQAFALFAMQASAGEKLPAGATVKSGHVAVSQPSDGMLLLDQTSDRAIVDWDSFSVGAGKGVRFNQPNAGSAILNRVSGNETSEIAGQISSNGQVFLINPNGIAITKTGLVETGGFVASTLDMADGDFKAGRYRFKGKGNSAEIANDGSIVSSRSTFAALLGGAVSNGGSISVPLGKIGLGAGEEQTLDFDGDGFLQVAVPSARKSGEKPQIDVPGEVTVEGGRVEIRAAAAANAMRDVVNLSGTVSATSAYRKGGTIVLDGGGGKVKVSGTLAAGSKKSTGGAVRIGGRAISLKDASVDVSGKTGGGSVHIGGGARGAALPGLTTAELLDVDSGSTMSADALEAGSGGQIVLWSDDDTRFHGLITAKALGDRGDGGEAEVSGGHLTYAGTTNLVAAHGKTGTLLLDPYNLTISSAADGGYSGWTANASGSNINTTTLQNALATASVTIATGASGSEAGDITIASPITWSTNSFLTLTAAGGIIINAPIKQNAVGSFLILNALGAGGISGSTAGTIQVADTVSFNLANSAANGVLLGAVSGAHVRKYGPGTLSLQGVNTYTGVTWIYDGILRISGAGSLGSGNYSNDIWFDTNAKLDYASSAAQTFSGVLSGAGQFWKNNTSTVTLTRTNTYSGATVINGGVLSLKGGTALSLATAVAINNGGTLRLDVDNIWGTGWNQTANPVITINSGGTLASNNSFNQLVNLKLNGGTLLANGGSGSSFWQAFGLGGVVTVTADSAFAIGPQGNGYTNIALGYKNSTTTEFNMAAGTTLTIANVLTNNGDYGTTHLNVTGAGKLLLTGANTYTGHSWVLGGTLQIGGSGTLGNGNYGGSIFVGGTFNYSSSANQTLTGLLYASGQLVKGNSSTLTLANPSNNTFDGGTTINGGLMVFSELYPVGATSTITINNGGTLRFDAWDLWGNAANSSVTPAITINHGGTLASNVRFVLLTNLTMNGGRLLANGGGSNVFPAFGLGGTINVTDDSTFEVGTGNSYTAVMLGNKNSMTTTFNIAAGKTLTVSNALANHGDYGAAGLAVTGGGTLDLRGVNTFTGGITISSGTLKLAGSAALNSGSYGGAISIASGSLFDYSSSAAQTLSGVLSGSGALTKNSASTLTLSGTSSYSGLATVNAGIVALNSVSALSTTATVVINNGATLRLDASNIWGSASTATATAAITVNQGGVLASSNSFNQIVNLTMNGGRLIANGGTSSALPAFGLGGTITVAENSSFETGTGNGFTGIMLGYKNAASPIFSIASGKTLTIANVLSNNGSTGPSGLTVSGGGTLELSAVNTFTGGIAISSGTLKLGGSALLNSGSYGGAISIASGSLFDYSSSAAQTLSGVLSGSGALTKNSASTLTLSGTSSYSGLATVNAGIVALNSVSALSTTATVVINNGATLRLDASNIWGSASTATATAAITVNQGGVLASSNSFNQIVNLTMNGGRLIANGGTSSALPAFGLGGTITVTENSSFETGTGNGFTGIMLGYKNAASPIFSIAAGKTLTIANVLSNNGSTGPSGLTVSGGGMLELSAVNTFTGGIAISSGTLKLGGSASLNSGSYGGAISIASGSLFDYSSSAAQTLSGVLSGSGALTKNSASTLTLTGSNSFGGPLTVNAGNLTVAGAGSLGSGIFGGAILIASGADFKYSSSAAQTLTGAVSGSGNIIKNNGASTLTLAAAGSYSGLLTVNAGIVSLDAVGAVATTSSIDINNGGTLRLDASNIWGGGISVTVSPTISIYQGGVLASNNSFNQIVNLTLAGGRLVANGGVMPQFPSFGIGGTITVTDDSSFEAGTSGNSYTGIMLGSRNGIMPRFDITAGKTLTVSNALVNHGDFGAAGLSIAGGGTLELSGTNTFTGQVSIGNGTLRIAGAGSLGSGNYASAISIGSGSLFDYSSSAAQTLTGVISGAGGLSKNNNASTLILATANTYTGATAVNEGILALNAIGALSNDTKVDINNGGTLRLDIKNIWGGALVQTASAAITVNQGGILASNNSFNQIMNLTLAGGRVIANGGDNSSTWQSFGFGGTVTVTENSSIEVGTSGNGKTIVMLGTKASLITTFAISSGKTLTIANTIINNGDFGAAGLLLNGGGTLELSGVNRFSGASTIANGTLRIAGSGSLNLGFYSGPISIASGSLFDYASTATQTLSGAISGSGWLTKNAASTLTLTGASSFNGRLTINSGILKVGSSGYLGSGDDSGDIEIAAGASFIYASSANQTISGAISGAGAFSKTSFGSTLTLSGDNSFDSAATISAGILNLSGTWTPLTNAASIVTAAGASFMGSGAITASTLTVSGGGTVSLTGANMVDSLGGTGTIGSLTFHNGQSLIVGSLAATGQITVAARQAGSDLTIAAGSVIASAATGTAVTLAGERRFINLAGSGAISAANGRWLVYSAKPSDDSFGGLNSGRTAVWNTSFGTAVAQTGNRYVFSIQPRATIISNSAIKTYGQDISSGLFVLYRLTGVDGGVSGAYAPDNVASIFSGVPLVTSAGAGAAANAGTYSVEVSQGSLVAISGYAFDFQSTGILTVGKATLTVTGADKSLVYDGMTHQNSGATYTGALETDSFTITGYASGTGAGSYADDLVVTANDGTLSSNYDVVIARQGTLTIAKASLTISGNSTETVYDGTEQTNGFVASGLKGSDKVTAVSGLASATNAGVYADNLSGATGNGLANYTINYVNGSLTIEKALLTLAGGDHSLTYDAGHHVNGGATYWGAVGDDSFTITGYGSGTGAGSYEDNLGVIGNGDTLASNYDVVVARQGVLTIAKAGLTIAGSHTALTYDGASHDNSYSVSGLVGDDTVDSVIGLGSGRNAGLHADHLTGATGTGLDNYEISFIDGSLTIAKAGLTISGDHKTLTYDGTSHVNGFAVSGLVGEDRVDTVAGLAAASRAGRYADALSGATGSGLANYDITYVDGYLDIAKASLIISAAGHTVTYNGAEQSSSFTVSGLKGQDSVDSVSGLTKTAAAGSYRNTLSDAVGTGLDNYDITYVDGYFNIAKAVLTLVGGDHSLTYDAGHHVNGGATYWGAVGDDSFTITGYGSGTGAGSYEDNLGVIGNGDTLASNYDVVVARQGVLTIAKAGLTIAGSHTALTYDGASHDNSYSVSGLVGDDTVDSVIGLGSGRNAGLHADHLTGATGTGLDNYEISFIDGSLTIAKAGLTISGDHKTLTYDGTSHVNGFAVSGLVGEDRVDTVAGLAAASRAGRYADALSGATGSGLANYDITYVDGYLDIAKASLIIFGGNDSWQYDGTAHARSFSTYGLVGADRVDTVSGLTSGINAGAYEDDLSAAFGSGLENYDISYFNGSLSISKARLTLTGADRSLGYDATSKRNGGATYQGAIGNDSFTITGYGTGTQAGVYLDVLGVVGNGDTLASNYDIVVARQGSLTITKAALTISGATGDKTYNAERQTNNYSVSGLFGSDTVNAVSGLASGLHAGLYADHLSDATGKGLSNYDISYVDGTLSIEKAKLTATANDASKFEDGQTWAGGNGITYNGFLGGDTWQNQILGQPVFGGDSQGAVRAGSYVIDVSGLTARDYFIDFLPGKLSIQPRPTNLEDYFELQAPLRDNFAARHDTVLFDAVSSCMMDNATKETELLRSGSALKIGGVQCAVIH